MKRLLIPVFVMCVCAIAPLSVQAAYCDCSLKTQTEEAADDAVYMEAQISGDDQESGRASDRLVFYIARVNEYEKLDPLTQSDPFVQCGYRSFGGEWIVLGETEIVMNCNGSDCDAVFQETFSMDIGRDVHFDTSVSVRDYDPDVSEYLGTESYLSSNPVPLDWHYMDYGSNNCWGRYSIEHEDNGTDIPHFTSWPTGSHTSVTFWYIPSDDRSGVDEVELHFSTDQTFNDNDEYIWTNGAMGYEFIVECPDVAWASYYYAIRQKDGAGHWSNYSTSGTNFVVMECPATPTPTMTPTALPVVINEIVYQSDGDDQSFVEIKGPPGASLDDYFLVGKNAFTGLSYNQVYLDGYTIPGDGYFVVGENNTVPEYDLLVQGVDYLVGPNSVQLRYKPASTGVTVDAVGYGGFIPGIHEFFGEGNTAGDVFGDVYSLSRLPDGSDTNNNSADFGPGVWTAGSANSQYTYTPTPTQTPTPSQTPTPTMTSTLTPTMTPSLTATPTVTPTATPTNTLTPSPTPTATTTPEGPVIGEIGTVTGVTHEWVQINLINTYTNPVVICEIPSFNGGAPIVPRLRNIGSGSFELRVQEPIPCLNDLHPGETMGYMVVEAGRYLLPDGGEMEAGLITTDQHMPNVEDIVFSAPFSEEPIVFSQVQTCNEEVYVKTRYSAGPGPDGFQLGLEPTEPSGNCECTVHAASETIGWIAWPEDPVINNGIPMELNTTSASVTHDWYPVDFIQSFQEPPVFVAMMQTRNGADGAYLRYDNLDAVSVEFFVEEDTCEDSETNHINGEVVGYFLAAQPGQLVGYLASPTPGCINSGDVNQDGTLTAGDAQDAFNIVMGLLTPTPEQACAADCTGDGSITAGDAQEIFSAVMGMGSCVDPI